MAGTWADIVRSTEPMPWREMLKRVCFTPEQLAEGITRMCNQGQGYLGGSVPLDYANQVAKAVDEETQKAQIDQHMRAMLTRRAADARVRFVGLSAVERWLDSKPEMEPQVKQFIIGRMLDERF